MAKIDDRCAHFLFFSLYVSIFAEFLFSTLHTFSQKSFQIVKGLLENSKYCPEWVNLHQSCINIDDGEYVDEIVGKVRLTIARKEPYEECHKKVPTSDHMEQKLRCKSQLFAMKMASQLKTPLILEVGLDETVILVVVASRSVRRVRRKSRNPHSFPTRGSTSF